MFWTLNCLICLWLWGGVRGQKLLPTLFDGGFNELYWVHLWWFDHLAQQYGFQHADNRILHKARDVLFKGLIWRSRLTSKNMHLGIDSRLGTTSSKLIASQMLLSCYRIVQAWDCIPSLSEYWTSQGEEWISLWSTSSRTLTAHSTPTFPPSSNWTILVDGNLRAFTGRDPWASHDKRFWKTYRLVEHRCAFCRKSQEIHENPLLLNTFDCCKWRGACWL